MKRLNIKFLAVLVSTVTLLLSSCMDEKTNDLNNTSSSNFDFKTIKDVNVTITTLNNNNEPLAGVYIEIYTQNPLDENGALKENRASILKQKGLTDATGVLASVIAPATTVDSLMILVNQIGLPNYHAVKLSTNDIKLVIGGKAASNVKYKVGTAKSAVIPSVKKTSNEEFFILGSWNNSGIPNYLVENDLISKEFLADINASLPERIQLPISHPEYLASKDDGSLVLEKDAEVWVTFVHEGAGFMNSLAYYTHPTDDAPKKSTDITDKTIIFPNASFSGLGGGLNSGNKVQLFYYNPATEAYTNVFPAGVTVCWLLRSNGWNGTTVGNGYNNMYSDARFNSEKKDENKKHNVVLKDENRKLFLLGFEDLNRETGADNDFNDVVIYATVTPFDAVKDNIYESIDTEIEDKDKDGVSDDKDDFPEDKFKAFKKYYPSFENNATLAFEDLWPSKGDYDFNDLVVDYNFMQTANAQNEIVEIDAKLTVRAIGASFVNGFGIELNTTPDNILSVNGQIITENIIKLETNGTEKNQDKAVIIAFDNAFSVTPHPGNGPSVNTVTGNIYKTPGIVNLKIVFKNPVASSQLGTEPFNPFIFINGDRGREVHLPTKTPTTLADESLFGKNDDSSSKILGKYYVSDKYLPWAINIPVQFDYPAEKQNITKAYKHFTKWVESKGTSYLDWYLNLDGYRDYNLIYRKQ